MPPVWTTIVRNVPNRRALRNPCPARLGVVQGAAPCGAAPVSSLQVLSAGGQPGSTKNQFDHSTITAPSASAR